MAIVVWIPPSSAGPSVIAFDFDTGSPTLSEGQNTPLDQTSGGVAAHFSSPSDPAAFSVQSYGTTFLTLSQFSGKYLYDNRATRDYLDIKFTAHLTSANLTFATIEAHGGPGMEPCNVTLTAYMDSTGNPPVGSAVAHGAWSNDSYPQGRLKFDSGGQPFNLVRIYLPYQRPGVTDFFVDDVVVITANMVDNSPPQTTINLGGILGNLGWYTSDVTVSLSATDDVSGVMKTEYSLDNITWTVFATPFALASEGTTTVYYRSTDNAGNIEVVKVQAVKVDKSAPVTTLSFFGVQGDLGWFTSPVTATLSGTDSVSGVAGTEYSYDNVTWTPYTVPFNIAGEGARVVYYRSTDSAGNVEAVKTQAAKIDMTAPTGAIIINGGDSSTPSTSVTLTVTSTDASSGVSAYRYGDDGTWDAEQWEAPSPTKAWTLTSGDGLKTVYAQIKDNAGLTSLTYQDSIVLATLDTARPVADAGPDRVVDEDTVVTLDGSASTDDVGVTGYTWTFMDVTARTLTGVTPTYTFESPGTYAITLNVTDAAGNWATDTAVFVVSDITDPVAIAGENRTVEAGATVSFDAGASYDNVGLVAYDWSCGDGMNDTGVTIAHVYDVPGTYTVTLTVRDAAGNFGTHAVTVTVLQRPSSDQVSLPLVILAIFVICALVAVPLYIMRRKRRQD